MRQRPHLVPIDADTEAFPHPSPARAGLAALADAFTGRREVEALREELARKEAALKAVTAEHAALLRLLADELRAPLTRTVGMAHALARTPLTGPQLDYVDILVSSADEVMVALNAALDDAEVAAGRIELQCAPTDIRELVQSSGEAFMEAAREKRLALSWRVDPEVPAFLKLDPRRVRQMLCHLIANAVKFTPKGSVEINVRVDEADGPRLLVTVSDTGQGLPADIAADMFWGEGAQAVPVAAGRGLKLVKHLARIMDGDVTFASRVQAGSAFCIEIPAVEAAPPAQADAPSEIREPISQMKLLAAEDNPVNQLVIHALLNGVVGSLTIVNDGVEALEALRRDDYDLVLMDVNMPHMGGVAAVAAVRAGEAGRADIPIVALTADAMSGDRERLLKAGFDDHLKKPIQPADLLAAVGRYAARVSAPGEAEHYLFGRNAA